MADKSMFRIYSEVVAKKQGFEGLDFGYSNVN
jgi:hypothetical protein